MKDKVLFPSWRYHRTEPPKLIHGPDEEQSDWYASPAFIPPADPELAPEATRVAPDSSFSASPDAPAPSAPLTKKKTWQRRVN